MKTIKKGSKGEEVKLLQELLCKAGFNVVVDSDFGQKTHDAVLAYQKSKSLVADGIVGDKTWAALGVKEETPKPVKEVHIIMNYGHAKPTPGKRSPLYSTLSKEEQAYFAKYPQFGTDRYYEYLSNRVIGKQITASLRERGWKVHEIEQTGANGLAEIANATQKIVKQFGSSNCIFISIHSNAASAKDNGWANAKGWCIYTTKGQNKSDKLADSIYKYAKLYLQEQDGRNIRKDTKDGDPDQEANFYVIYHCNCPGVLTENFFFNDKEDLKYLVSEKGQNSIVRVHVMGIEDYIYNIMLK